MPNQGHWTGLKADPYNYFGFIYLITDLTSGRKYVGKKQYWMAKKQNGCKSRVSDRQSDRWKCKCWREGSWREYRGSSPSLKKWMKLNPDNEYEFKILYQCRSKGVLHYAELKEMWDRDVLVGRLESGEYRYFNRSIGAIRFRPPEFASEETRKKMREAQKGAGIGRKLSDEAKKKIGEANKRRVITEETRKKMSESGKKKKFTEEHKKNLSEASKGKKHSEESKKKIGNASKGRKHSEESKIKMREAAKKRREREHKRKKR